MKHLNVEKSKQPAYVVRQDVEAQHKKFWATFSPDKRKLALQVREIATLAYFRSRTFLNAREKFITVKVMNPTKADALQSYLEICHLKSLVDMHGIELVSTKTSLLFRIPI